MLPEAFLVIAASAIGIWLWARSGRHALYRRLEGRIDAIMAGSPIDLVDLRRRPLPSFVHRLAVMEAPLSDATLTALRVEAQHLMRPERSYIPTHKKGGTVAYETLFDEAPKIVAFYQSRELRALIAQIVGEDVHPTPLNDQSSLSVLFYEKPGDHIGWHYDHNFYRGRHFTVLLPVINEGRAAGGLSHATLWARIGGGETAVATPPNTLVLFEGARVQHKVEPILEGERRLVISMTFCTDPRCSSLQGIVRRIKDVAFFGPRALWT